jgi:hypothetical protein
MTSRWAVNAPLSANGGEEFYPMAGSGQFLNSDWADPHTLLAVFYVFSKFSRKTESLAGSGS